MLKKIDNHLEDLLMVVLLCVMSLLIFVQVIMRYIFNMLFDLQLDQITKDPVK